MNFRYSKEICENMLDKSIKQIDCSRIKEKVDKKNNIEISKNSTASANAIQFNQLEINVCDAEIKIQKLMSDLDAKITPFEVIFSIVVILFVSGWSDRYGKRKFCLILPTIGFITSNFGMKKKLGMKNSKFLFCKSNSFGDYGNIF